MYKVHWVLAGDLITWKFLNSQTVKIHIKGLFSRLQGILSIVLQWRGFGDSEPSPFSQVQHTPLFSYPTSAQRGMYFKSPFKPWLLASEICPDDFYLLRSFGPWPHRFLLILYHDEPHSKLTSICSGINHILKLPFLCTPLPPPFLHFS